ncbi:hypothetical protein MPC4_30055 [Methylocella tundrae]|uniref:Uncharacterized protein n=1 Tax=Methylocella tundrae TaxID=227605 RepID=A0A8B6M8R6_METTU|nr:hypothetical protein MPC1_5910003 [Methylocella tundrae]VTZ50871.1 hypothetical protein MPC4_30055 [Methylocella tundrae]
MFVLGWQGGKSLDLRRRLGGQTCAKPSPCTAHGGALSLTKGKAPAPGILRYYASSPLRVS